MYKSFKRLKCFRYLNIFLSLTLLCTCLCGVMPVSAEAPVNYIVEGYGSDRDFTLTVSLSGTHALAGRLALSFDADKLELSDVSSFDNAIIPSDSVYVTTEALDTSVMLSNVRGYAMFAWYSRANSGIDATYSSVPIATIPFRIKPGYTMDDFSKNTFGVRYVNESMVSHWDCSASVNSYDLVKYSNTAKNSKYLCGVMFDYPNCDYVPISTYDATIMVTDLYGAPIGGASVVFDGNDMVTDLNGMVTLPLENGTYNYRVEAAGYETQDGYITVSNAPSSVSVRMKSYKQMVQATANDIEIEYVVGDNAANVTAGIGLVKSGINGETITWQSSNPSVVTNQGIVIRPNDDTNVVMTATVSYGGEMAEKSFNITVRGTGVVMEMNKLAVEMDANALDIGYAPGDSINNVTSNITLPSLGSYGSSILWNIGDLNIINEYGEVTRPSSDTYVTLTATIMRGDVKETRVFNLLVKAPPVVPKSDDELVREVLNLLTIGYADGDSQYSVTKALTLVTNGTDGVEISWQSSAPAIITGYGGVVRQYNDCSVTLTATVSKGSAMQQKSFNVTVKAAEVTPINPDISVDIGSVVRPDSECVTLDKNAIKIIFAPGDNMGSVTAGVTLPATGEYGSQIFWESSNPEIMSSYGSIVSRPQESSFVTLTAVVTKGGASETATFNLTVKGAASASGMSDQKIVDEVANALEIIYSKGDSAGNVRNSLTLPTVGANDTTITWTSSNPSVIATNGSVTQKRTDTTVMLTAKIVRGGVSATKEFTLLVSATKFFDPSTLVGEDDETLSDLMPTQNPNATQAPAAATQSPTDNNLFTDLGTVPWAAQSILALAEIGVINGTSEYEFSPDADISRGDFITLLVRMLDLSGELGEGFSDVPTDMYYYQPITLAKTMGIITGIGDNLFDPEGNITRQDMMTMTYRALSALGTDDFVASDLSNFVDKDFVADYALESVSNMVGSGFIAGDENHCINPWANTTRAETAVFLYRLYLVV